MDINKIIGIIRDLREEGSIANVVGTGEKSLGYNIETGTPPVYKKKKPPIIARGKLPGARKRWMK